MPEDTKRQSTLYDVLMERRTVVLSGSTTRDALSEIGVRLMKLQIESADPINLLIDSGGGDTFAALRLCDFMTYVITAPIHGVAIGTCSSSATFILLHCAKRAATPYARFLIHSATVGGVEIKANESRLVDIERLRAEIATTDETVTRLYMQKLNKTEKEVKELIARGDNRFNDYLSATEALEIGLIEKILDGPLDIFPQPTKSEN